jgi:predicted Zn-dependent peptidase
MFKATDTTPAGEYLEASRRAMAGRTTRATSYDYTELSSSASPSDRLPQMMRLEADRMVRTSSSTTAEVIAGAAASCSEERRQNVESSNPRRDPRRSGVWEKLYRRDIPIRSR